MAWDATTSTLIFGENDAVLVDTLTTADEAEALARARAIATPKSVELMPKTADELAGYRKFLPGLPTAITVPEPYDKDVITPSSTTAG
jgi:hypothetical protein